MADFINLNEEQESIIFPDHLHSISNIKPNTKVVDGKITKEEVDGICADYGVIEIGTIGSREVETSEEPLCVKDDCDISKYYGCTSENNGFQKDNLFSELTDEYQRTIARINLGIADSYALKWGNITGNLLNQKDLYTFVTDQIAQDINRVVEEINLKLAQWACEIEVRLNNKADNHSPHFTGEPTTTLPLITDNSNRIASTEWVNAKLEELALNDNVKSMTMTPEYIYYDEGPVNIEVEWEYYNDVTEQFINNTPLETDVRHYTFTNISDSFIIILKYKQEDKYFTKVLTFCVKHPTFYGTSMNYKECNKTSDNKFTVDAGTDQYIYVLIPNGRNAELGVSNIIGGFILVGTQELLDTLYYIYKSANYGLGETTVKIFD